MFSIREGMFETNSSSCHTFCVKGKDDQIKVLNLGEEFAKFPEINEDLSEIKLSFDDYGSKTLDIYLTIFSDNGSFLQDPNEKIDYLTTYFLSSDCAYDFDFDTEEEIEAFNNLINHEETNDNYFKENCFVDDAIEFFDKLKEISGAEKIKIHSDGWYSIDHASVNGTLNEIIEATGTTLENIIKNKNILIHIGRDDYNIYINREFYVKDLASKIFFNQK